MGGFSYETLKNAITGSTENGGKRTPYFSTPEGRGIYTKARKMLSEGMLVFVSKESLDRLETLMGGKRPSKKAMRLLIEDISTGKLKLTVPGGPSNNGNGKARQLTPGTETALYTLKQAAKVLNVHPSSLYFRAVHGRIRTVRHGSRWLLDEAEISRLKDLGI